MWHQSKNIVPELPAVVVVLLIGAAIRWGVLGRQGLFLDEAWPWAIAQMSVGSIVRLTLTDPHPPLYYLLLKGALVLLPPTEAGLRALSVVCSVVSLTLLMILAGRWWGWRASLFAGWLAALSSFDLYYAQETRMYALLALLWLTGYGLLAEALRQRVALLIPLGIVHILLILTHFYGLLVVGTHLAFCYGLLVWAWWRKQPPALSPGWVGVCTGITALGLGPMLVVASYWSARGSVSGGAWVPQPSDLAALLALSGAGLTAARDFFLDSQHLVIPALAGVPGWVWLLASLPSAGLAVLAGWHSWRCGGRERLQALLVLMHLVLPVGGAFSYAFLFQERVWALKCFLGLAYIGYLWAGAGLSQLPWRIMRLALAGLALVVALASLVPYFTFWSKTDAKQALRSLPAAHGTRPVLLLDRPYMAPVAFYYLGTSITIWSTDPVRGPEGVLAISPQETLLGKQMPLNCTTIEAYRVSDLWVYAAAGRLQEVRHNWPSCLHAPQVWIFDGIAWVREPGG